jgi:hypothetical protein
MRSTRRNAATTSRTESGKNAGGANAKRRGFLLALGAGGAGAAAIAARSLTSVAPQSESRTPDESQGYRVTDHIKRYYQTAKT